ncbi:MAG: MBOAT family O-acyltransferase [Bacillota bacterium]|nr:MBOAT family O-acyltransferase [Bacillota bacterium]
MAFTSFYFLIFALATVCVYYAIPIKWRWLVLLTASYAFYLISSPKTFVFVLFTTVITFFGGKKIGEYNTSYNDYMAIHKKEMSRDERKEAKAANQKKKRKIVALILILNFGILAVLKYFRYYLQAMGLFDTGTLLIPLGISFYTFQSAAYIIDLYRNKMDADTNIAKFALFTSFFSQIIQGPIPRHNQLAPQLYEGHKFDYHNLSFGAQLILWGFFKKLIIADRVAIPCSQIFDNYTDYSGLTAFMGFVFYTIQIYADFSGGIDIARGVSKCMGIDLSLNFCRPYFSDSLSEFWRRWHMSLSFWCRDYIFYPVAMSKFFGRVGTNLRKTLGNHVGQLFPIIIAQYATFITIGIWHGAEFKYIAYGLYNGTIIVMGLLLEPLFVKWLEKLHINRKSRGWKLFGIVRTFVVVSFGRAFPKAASFSVAISMIASVFRGGNGTPFAENMLNLGITEIDYLILLVGCVIWFVISLCEEKHMLKNGGDGTEGFRERLENRPLVLRWLILLAGFAMVLALGVYGPGYDASAFIYRGF